MVMLSVASSKAVAGAGGSASSFGIRCGVLLLLGSLVAALGCSTTGAKAALGIDVVGTLGGSTNGGTARIGGGWSWCNGRGGCWWLHNIGDGSKLGECGTMPVANS